MERTDANRSRKRDSCNQSNRFLRPLSRFDAAKGQIRNHFERGKKVSLNRAGGVFPSLPTHHPSSSNERTSERRVISGAVKLSFGYQRDATPRARIRAREVIWLSETQTLPSACPKVVEYNGPDERTNSHPRATKQPSAIVAQSIMESRPRRL